VLRSGGKREDQERSWRARLLSTVPAKQMGSPKKARKNGSLSLAVEIAGDLAAEVVACG